MKTLRNIMMGAAAMGLVVTTSCTDLEETLYSDLNETNIEWWL